MAKLPSALAAQTEEADGTAFSALDPGIYTARLAKVEVTQAKASGNPMWKLEFDEIHDLAGKKKPGRQWTNLVLIPEVTWKLAQFFDAFGVSADTDTDDLLGSSIRLQIVQRTIGAGSKMGQIGNEIDAFMPLDESDSAFGAGAAAKPAAKAAPAKVAPAKAAANAAEDF